LDGEIRDSKLVNKLLLLLLLDELARGAKGLLVVIRNLLVVASKAKRLG